MPQFPLEICDEKLKQLSADWKCPVSLWDRSSEINGGKRCGWATCLTGKSSFAINLLFKAWRRCLEAYPILSNLWWEAAKNSARNSPALKKSRFGGWLTVDVRTHTCSSKVMWEHNEIESQVLDFSKGFTLLKDFSYNPQSVQTLFNSQFILVEDKPKILMVICITKEHITSFAVE